MLVLEAFSHCHSAPVLTAFLTCVDFYLEIISIKGVKFVYEMVMGLKIATRA